MTTISPIELRRIVDASLKRHRPALDAFIAVERRRLDQRREARRALVALLLILAGVAYAVFTGDAS